MKARPDGWGVVAKQSSELDIWQEFEAWQLRNHVQQEPRLKIACVPSAFGTELFVWHFALVILNHGCEQTVCSS